MTIAQPHAVVVPVDFSAASFAAVKEACELTGAPDKVHVLYVAPAPQTEADYLREALTKHDLGRVSEELKAKLAAEGFSAVNALVTEGFPADEICATAEKLDADCIVIPSHSRKGISRLFLGSVTNEVLRSAPCPVLVLRRK